MTVYHEKRVQQRVPARLKTHDKKNLALVILIDKHFMKLVPKLIKDLLKNIP